jgi:U5 snRNP spliceosome subunit
MTNDPYRSAGPGGSAGGEPPVPERPQPDPVLTPSESVWSRPDREPAGPPPEAQPTWTPEATPSAGTDQPTDSPSPWPPAAAAQSTQPPGGYPPPPYQPPPYQPPAYQPQGYQPSAYPPPPGQAPPPAGGRTNPLAIVALICSLAGIFTGISAPIGAILGHVSLGQIRQSGEEGSQLATVAIWVGWIITGLIVAAICAVAVLAVTLSRTAT